MTLPAMAKLCSHVEVTFPLGARVLMTSAAYAALQTAQLAGTRARLVPRVELIAALANARRS